MKRKDKPKAGAMPSFIKFEEFVKISSLKPHPKNPRVHEKTIKDLADSIRRFGFNSPVVALADGTILAGHARVRAAQECGLFGVPVVYVKLAEKDALAYLVADNKVGELTAWDDQLLGEMLATLPIAPPGFSESLFETLVEASKSKKEPKARVANVPEGDIDTLITCPKCNAVFKGRAIKRKKSKTGGKA